MINVYEFKRGRSGKKVPWADRLDHPNDKKFLAVIAPIGVSETREVKYTLFYRPTILWETMIKDQSYWDNKHRYLLLTRLLTQNAGWWVKGED